MSRIGFFGGSFNPPTNAHINLAKQIVEECSLDKLVFVPIGDFYKKNELIEFKHRYTMLKIICDLNEKLEVSDIESNQLKKLYAIDIFKIIKNKYPKDDIYYIMGSDNLEKVDTWKESTDLITKYKYIIIERNKNDFKRILDENSLIKKYIANYTLIYNNKYNSISSTIVREKISNGENIFNLIPEEIQEYIIQNNLYKKD